MRAGYFKKIISLALGLVLTASLLPVRSARAAEADLESIVEQQIRAFADSIDKKDADDAAAEALAKHGITGGGKTLKVGKSHALTATLMNSEMLQAALIEGCTAAIELMQGTDEEHLRYIRGVCDWYGAKSAHQLSVYAAPEKEYSDRLTPLIDTYYFEGTRNDYDAALDWMVASSSWDLEIRRVKTDSKNMVYVVTSTIRDRFDFNTSKGSGFSKLISALGALLFREFDWNSTVTFQLTVPYHCTHSSANYRWVYDAERYVLTSDSSEEFAENAVTRHPYEKSGVTYYYHQLENAVRLRCDSPWVLEYDVKSNFSFALASVSDQWTALPILWHNARSHLLVRNREYRILSEAEVKEHGVNSNLQTIDHDYGIGFKDKFGFSADHTYTFRLENEVSSKGENMLFLTVYDHDLGKTVLEKTAMEEHYVTAPWGKHYVLQSEPSSWVSGKDFYISYIGSRFKQLNADSFELRIWENGEGAEAESLCTKKVTKPTCTAKGYTTYTCAACGYSWKGDSVKAKGHSYKVKETAPTCTEDGSAVYTCSSCKDSYTETIPALGHAYSAGLCGTCGEDTVTASLDGNDFTLSGELAEGTRVFAACYDGEGRFTGGETFLWQGEPLTATLPDAAEVKLFFADEGHAPLREGIRLR